MSRADVLDRMKTHHIACKFIPKLNDLNSHYYKLYVFIINCIKWHLLLVEDSVNLMLTIFYKIQFIDTFRH